MDGVPIQSTMLLIKKSFHAAGRLMALSLIKGGPSPALLSESSYKFISSDSLPPPSELWHPKIFINKNQPIRRYSM